jgi:hypothetical protein
VRECVNARSYVQNSWKFPSNFQGTSNKFIKTYENSYKNPKINKTTQEVKKLSYT